MIRLGQLNGWQRLWLVFAFFWGLVTVVPIVMVLPTEAKIMKRWADEVVKLSETKKIVHFTQLEKRYGAHSSVNLNNREVIDLVREEARSYNKRVEGRERPVFYKDGIPDIKVNTAFSNARDNNERNKYLTDVFGENGHYYGVNGEWYVTPEGLKYAGMEPSQTSVPIGNMFLWEMDAIDKKYNRELRLLVIDQAKVIGLWILFFWLGGVAVVYLLGWTVGWVYKGFRK